MGIDDESSVDQKNTLGFEVNGLLRWLWCLLVILMLI